MALTVATNTGALMAQAAASSVNKEMEISMERLSTGKRINGASDDAAGVAIASRLTSEIRGTNQAIRNAMDGQAMIDTAEGAHQEVETLLQRMRELAVQAANDTNNGTDRTNLQTEFDALVDEIDRISAATTWAGQSLLDGSGGSSGTFSFHVGSGNANAVDNVSVTLGSIASTGSIMTASNATLASYKESASAGTVNDIKVELLQSDGSTAATDFSITDGDTVNASDVLNSDGEFFVTADTDTTVATKAASMKITLNGADTNNDVVITVALTAGSETETTIATKLYEALNSNSVLPGIAINNDNTDAGKLTFSAANNSTGSGGLMTAADARTVIGALDTMIQAVNTQRAELGSMSNRLDSTVSNLTNISSNLQAGKGRIEDADFAAETTNLAKSQILQQASTAMLAQANASKQNVLSLLHG
jgi:flagellin